MDKIFIAIVLVITLSGCVSVLETSDIGYADDPAPKPQNNAFTMQQLDVPESKNEYYQLAYDDDVPVNHIGHYVRNLAQDLVANMESINPKTPVGVTHFALLDSDLNQTNLLGLQIAESMMHEFHQFRIPVVEFKSTDFVSITQGGDFFLSRDVSALTRAQPMDYIITGTMVKHRGGIMVNARVVAMANKQLVASAQQIIPAPVVEAIIGTSTSGATNMNKGIGVIADVTR